MKLGIAEACSGYCKEGRTRATTTNGSITHACAGELHGAFFRPTAILLRGQVFSMKGERATRHTPVCEYGRGTLRSVGEHVLMSRTVVGGDHGTRPMMSYQGMSMHWCLPEPLCFFVGNTSPQIKTGKGFVVFLQWKKGSVP